MNKIDSHIIWQGFHWSFFINIQGLIIAMLRFEKFITQNHLRLAGIELKTATDLMLAAAASMELAGDFTREEYEQQIRPTMMPPKVKSENFSGLMFWDHAYLMKIWQRIQPKFQRLPPKLKSEQDEFIQAYLTLSESHKKVCRKFGGKEISSLHSQKVTAVTTLNKFEHSRHRLISRK
ncbi:MAG: siderophore biosynthesis protein [Cyanobacteria bacterium P01_G01_bin.67]